MKSISPGNSRAARFRGIRQVRVNKPLFRWSTTELWVARRTATPRDTSRASPSTGPSRRWPGYLAELPRIRFTPPTILELSNFVLRYAVFQADWLRADVRNGLDVNVLVLSPV